MKRPLALLASFLVLFVLGATLGIAQANPPQAPETTPTSSSTPTATETGTTTATPTMTSTATTDPCDGAPPPPDLVAPSNGATVNKTQVTLRWSAAPCAVVYRFVIRTSSNAIVQRGRTKKLRATTKTLSHGATYYWTIKACNPGKGCDHSPQRHFRIQGVPTPIPPTPGPTGQPTTPPNGTPVPGTPPGNLVNYNSPDRGGTGVYLNNDNSALFRYECGKDQTLWGHYPLGSTVYNIALWYYPNEKINYKRLDFNTTQIVETHTLTANSDGYVSYNVDTSSWTPNHHFHLIFEGQSSHVSWCGHFDVQTTATDAELDALPHTAADVERVYRAAGLDVPR